MNPFNYDEIAIKIRSQRESLGYSYQDLADKTGMSKSTLQRYETGGIKNIPITRLRSLSEALNYDVNDLIGIPAFAVSEIAVLTSNAQRIGQAYEKATPSVQRIVEVALEPFMREKPPDNVTHVDFTNVPHPEQAASAGKGIDLDDEYMSTIPIRTSALPKEFHKAPNRYFSIWIAGDSMEPRYHDNDLLLVNRTPVNVGEIGIFTMDGKGYLKKLGAGVLHSLNHHYEDIPLTEDITCNGKVVKVIDPEDIGD